MGMGSNCYFDASSSREPHPLRLKMLWSMMILEIAGDFVSSSPAVQFTALTKDEPWMNASPEPFSWRAAIKP
jgi:hypothetical protein